MTEFYSIYIETGSSPLSGTRNDVEVKLFGSQNTTEYMELTSFDDIPWEKNQNRTFHLGKLNIGDLEAVEFRLKLQNDQKLDPLWDVGSCIIGVRKSRDIRWEVRWGIRRG